MEDFLYLDTARVGRPSAKTIHAATDSLALAADEGGSAYFDRFLRSGLTECPSSMQARYPGLQSWRGITALKADLQTLAGGPTDLPVLLANRSAQLMQFAAWLFFPRCRNVLTCDLGWPAYQSLLAQHAARAAGQITLTPLREMVFGDRATAEEVVEAVVQKYLSHRCDGLFLPAVSNLGVRLPVERIVRRIEAVAKIRLVVVDGSQQFCHTAAELATDYCDLYLTGCHKWLSGHHPMDVGFYGRRRSREFVGNMLEKLIEAGFVDDPLLRFTEQLEDKRVENYTETVNLAGLFTCQAAVAEAHTSGVMTANLSTRLATREFVSQIAAESGWQAERVDPALQTAILLVQAKRNEVRQTDPVTLRFAFRERGVGVTTYENGFVRLSMSSSFTQPQDLQRLSATFQALA